VAKGRFRRGKIALLMAATVSQKCRPPIKASQNQRSQRQKITLLGFAVNAHVHRISAANHPPHFAEEVPSTLYVDVLRAWDATILVEIHDLAIPAARVQFLAQADQAHAPTTHWRRPVPD